jgi:methyl-accepting chemotaxis protein
MASFVRDLSLARKLLVLGLVALVMVALPLTGHLGKLYASSNATRAELAGLTPSRALLKVVQLSQQHRGLSASALSGNAEFEARRKSKQGEVDQAMANWAAIAQRDIANPRIRNDSQAMLSGWQTLSKAVAAQRMTSAESTSQHTLLISHQIELHDRMAEHFGLTLDPNAGSYFMNIATLQKMPRLTEALGLARAIGALILNKKEGTPAQKAALAAMVEQARVGAREVNLTMEKAFDADASARAAMGQTLAQSMAAVDSTVKLARDNILDAAVLSLSAAEYFKATTDAIDTNYAMSDLASRTLESLLEQRLRGEVRAQGIVIASTGLMLAIGIWLAVFISRSIVHQTACARAAAERIAAGDLTTEIAITSHDELGQLLQSMREMQVSLSRVVGEVRRNAEGVATASAQIAQGNLDLSSRTEEQSSALQQTAASMVQLNATVKQNAESAREGNEMARDASSIANRGGAVVGQVVKTMTGINDSSQRIADIISVIDGIAFQTNILALNAAVEAARAGELGRGFAVVAGEVRSLAGRASDAAKEIKQLIHESVARAGQGSALAHQAGETMSEIVAAIAKVTDIMGEISSANTEQSNGIAQIDQAVSHMDLVTQQNAALVEESAAAAASLKQQAQALVHAVSAFEVPRLA